MYTKLLQGWTKHWDFMLLDILCMHIAFIVVYAFYFERALAYANPIYMRLALIITLLNIVTVIAFGTYKNVIKRGYYLETVATIKQDAIILLEMSLYYFMFKNGSLYSRVFTFLFLALYFILSLITRILYKGLLFNVKRGSRKMVLVAYSDNVSEIIRTMNENNYGSFEFIGIGLLDGDTNQEGSAVEGIEVIATGENIFEYLCKNPVDEVILGMKNQDDAKAYSDKVTTMGITVHSILSYENTGKSDGKSRIIEKVGGYAVLTTSINSANIFQMFIKRIIDILGAIAGLIVTLLLIITIGPIIYIKSPGNIFFKQERVGLNGRKFKMYKFRSMYLDAEERKKSLMDQNTVKDGMMFKLDFDPRIIGNEILPDGKYKKGIGAFIREKSLDEFPQFLNVLKGDMSLVGTRPPTIDEYEKYKLHHRARLAIKPGITGMWQVSGRSDITDFEEVVALDTEYINNWNIGLDFRILFTTVIQVFTGKGAK